MKIYKITEAFGKQLFNREPNLKECARTIDLLLKELLVELEKRRLRGTQSLSEIGGDFNV